MWKLESSERVSHWRVFRKTLDSMTLDQALEAVAAYWQPCTFVPYYLDLDKSDSWPSPWDLIYNNTYCDLAKCLGIVYTITLTAHRNQLDTEIRVYKDTTTGYEYNLAWFNQGKYVLNMIDGAVVNNKQFDKTLELIKQYTAVELQLENY
jgi:hypothetical protein